MPAEVEEKARTCLLNGYGIGLGSHPTPYAPVARRAALAIDGEQAGDATMLCDGRKVPIAGAALANSALFHGRGAGGHLRRGASRRDHDPAADRAWSRRAATRCDRLIPALVAGYEAGGLLESAYAGAGRRRRGLRSSATYGTMRGRRGRPRMMELDAGADGRRDRQRGLFLAAGILQSFADGTDEWRYQVGVCGRSGLVAAELARAGSVSAPHAQSRGRPASSGPSPAPTAMSTRWPRSWAATGRSPASPSSPIPVCAFNQTPVTAALRRARRDRRGARSRRCA